MIYTPDLSFVVDFNISQNKKFIIIENTKVLSQPMDVRDTDDDPN